MLSEFLECIKFLRPRQGLGLRDGLAEALP